MLAETQTTTGTVYIVDDNEAVRDAIRWLVEEVGLTAKTFATANEFLNEHMPATQGCLVLDIRMPGMSGLELQEHLIKNNVSVPIIVVTGHGDVPMAVRSMKNGAFEFFQKPFNDQDLLDCIYAAIKNHQSILTEQLRNAETNRNLASLTRREQEVLRLLRAGEPSREIASKLHISVRTVEGHRARIMDKMHATTIAQLIEITHKAAGT